MSIIAGHSAVEGNENNSPGGADQDHAPLLSLEYDHTWPHSESRGHMGHVPSMCPGCLLALASYIWPDADDVAGRDVLRLEAVLEMRAIARGCRHG